MKIPFDIKYRPQIESGEYKVETRDGRPVRIICWDCNNYNPIIALADNTEMWNGDKKEYILSYCVDGHHALNSESQDDLFIVTPEEELNVFEEGLNAFLFDFVHTTVDEDPIEYVKKNSGVLLPLAREQFIKDGYVIEKKAFRDAVKKVDPKVMKEVSEKWDAMKEALRIEYEKGKADALKDLPRWKEIGQGNNYSSEAEFCINGRYLEMNDTLNCLYEIALKDLEKLPKEDEK